MRLYYSYGPVEGLNMHDTADEARSCADVELDYHRERSHDGWHEDVESVEWGELLPMAEARECNRKDTPGRPFDYTCDYQLHTVQDRHGRMRDAVRRLLEAQDASNDEEMSLGVLDIMEELRGLLKEEDKDA